MNRKSFFKSIAMLAVAPEIIAEMDLRPPIKQPMVTKWLVSDLKLLTPQFYSAFTEKYKDVEYARLMNEMGKNTTGLNQYFWFESNRI